MKPLNQAYFAVAILVLINAVGCRDNQTPLQVKISGPPQGNFLVQSLSSQTLKNVRIVGKTFQGKNFDITVQEFLEPQQSCTFRYGDKNTEFWEPYHGAVINVHWDGCVKPLTITLLDEKVTKQKR